MIAKSLTGFAATAALLMTTQAQAAQKGECLTKDEMRGVVAFALPMIIDGMVERCRSRLPSDAYLSTKGPALANAARAGQEAAWPLARKGILKMAGGGTKDEAAMFEDLPMEIAEPMFASVIESRFLGEMKTRDCADADAVLSAMAPMKSGNLVDLITAVMVIGARDDKEISICDAD